MGDSSSTTPRQRHVSEGKAWGSTSSSNPSAAAAAMQRQYGKNRPQASGGYPEQQTNDEDHETDDSYDDDSSAGTSAISTAQATPDTSRPTSPTGQHRPSRLSFSTTNGRDYQNGKKKRSSSSRKSQSGALSGSLGRLHASLNDLLKKQAETSSVAGSVARQLLSTGSWVEDQVELEYESRKNAIGGLDNLWLVLSSTTSDFNPVCTSTYTFDEPIEFDRVAQGIERQTERFPRYRQKLADVGRRWHGARFIDDPDWDVRNHLREENLPEPAGPAELDAFTGKFIAQGWSWERPLWDAVLLPNFVDPASGAKGAMVTRGHHTMADGQGFVASQLAVTSYGAEMERTIAEGAKTLRDARRGTAKPSKLNKALKPLDKFHRQPWLQAVMFVLYWLVWTFQISLDFYGSFYQAWTTSVIFLLTFWRQRYATAPPPKQSKEAEAKNLAGQVGAGGGTGTSRAKEFSASRAFPIDDVKKLQRAFSGPQPGGWADWLAGDKKRKSKSRFNHLTLNDIVCTIVSDVIADELDARGRGPGLWNKFLSLTDYVLPNPVGLFIPISIRPLTDWSMRNWSTGAIAYLPVGHGLPTSVKALYKRLHANRARLSVVKHSLLPAFFFHLVELTGQTPILFPSTQWPLFKRIVKWSNEVALSSFTAVLTNVPGPGGEKIELQGRQIQRWTALPPQAGKSTLGIGVISYAGTIAISVSADYVPESAGVSRRLTSKFERRWQQYLDAADEVLAGKA